MEVSSESMIRVIFDRMRRELGRRVKTPEEEERM